MPIVPETYPAEAAAFEVWLERALIIWDQSAPSYVRADMRPLRGNLREMYELGVGVDDWRETIEIAFVKPSVTKRGALEWAYSVLRVKFGGV